MVSLWSGADGCPDTGVEACFLSKEVSSPSVPVVIGLLDYFAGQSVVALITARVFARREWSFGEGISTQRDEKNTCTRVGDREWLQPDPA